VEAFRAYAEVSNYDQLELSANLAGDEMLELEEGMPVTVELVNRPGETYQGYIRSLPFGTLTDSSENDESTRIALEVDPEEAGLDSGDLMRVTVVLEHRENVLWLPPQAIRVFEGRNFVVVQEEGFQQRVDVKLGIESDDRIEIEDGLEEGQVVIAP
jgi:multidrug efflux pump subunit AcrA (membrane-fusion protein)